MLRISIAIGCQWLVATAPPPHPPHGHKTSPSAQNTCRLNEQTPMTSLVTPQGQRGGQPFQNQYGICIVIVI